MKRLALLLTLLLCSSASAAAPSIATKYSLAGGCWAVGSSGPLYLKASSLGSYLLYTADGRYVTATNGDLSAAATPGMNSVWNASKSGSAFTFASAAGDGAISGPVSPAAGCADFPEVSLNATGARRRAASTRSPASRACSTSTLT